MTSDERPELRKKRLGRRVGRWLLKRLADFEARSSLVGDRPVFDNRAFPFIDGFEREWRTIRAELDAVLAERDRLPAFHEISPDQYRISRGDQWKVFILYGFGEPNPGNCARCPETTRLLKTVPGLQSAWFSILAPNYHIPRHRGVTKGVLRVHLGLKVPARREECTMEVDRIRVAWEEGKAFVFDDFFDHEVWNNTGEERAILLFDFVRPMTLPGRLVNDFLLWGVKQSAYYKDARRNLDTWDQRLEAAVQRAETMLDEPAAPP
jgi:beta-hydroxylase